MTGSWEVFGVGISLLLVGVATAIYFAYVWLRTHGVSNMRYAHVDQMAGDEGED